MIDCYGDSTGSIQVIPSGGFGGPYLYSIDNGLNYSGSTYFDNLPGGNYQVVVVDQEHCTGVGPLASILQPDPILVAIESKEDILVDTAWNGVVDITDGSLLATATGGNVGYQYKLLPDGALQPTGLYTFPLEDSGNYVVEVVDSKGCSGVSDTVEINVIYTSHVGVGGSEVVEVKYYPNPTSGILNLEMPFNGNEVEIEVISMNGQVVLKRQVYPSGGVINETLDLSDQAKGLYLLRINGEALQSAIMVK